MGCGIDNQGSASGLAILDIKEIYERRLPTMPVWKAWAWKVVPGMQGGRPKTETARPAKCAVKGPQRPTGRLITAVVNWGEADPNGIRMGWVYGLWEGGRVWAVRVYETARGTRDFDNAKKKWTLNFWPQRRTFEELGQEFRRMVNNKFDPMDFEMASPDLIADLGKWMKR